MCSKYARVCNIYKRYVTPGHFINFSTEFLIDGLYGLRKFFVFNSKDPRLQIHVEVYDAIVPILNFETHCSSSAASKSQIQWWSRP